MLGIGVSSARPNEILPQDHEAVVKVCGGDERLVAALEIDVRAAHEFLYGTVEDVTRRSDFESRFMKSQKCKGHQEILGRGSRDSIDDGML